MTFREVRDRVGVNESVFAIKSALNKGRERGDFTLRDKLYSLAPRAHEKTPEAVSPGGKQLTL